MCLGEFGKAGEAAAQLVECQRRRLTHRGGLQVDGELACEPLRQPPGSMRSREAADGAQQRAVVIDGSGHLVVEALVVLLFDPVGAELDSLADQDSGAGVTVVVAELGARHRDREARRKRQSGELHLGLHLCPAAVTHRIVEVAGELHEQLSV